ncbi:hypothetical protein NM208_g10852 [Fusarium decemcellulare]|uniref:Uncharacterized protein n=1 Tax=Fusarium decemcellulare TaxID=57161 RepID=A0ACC1RWE2_9HYPO|nr:hypothetical protein NM208_g10852 [Fusarium decemcellulare]
MTPTFRGHPHAGSGLPSQPWAAGCIASRQGLEAIITSSVRKSDPMAMMTGSVMALTGRSKRQGPPSSGVTESLILQAEPSQSLGVEGASDNQRALPSPATNIKVDKRKNFWPCVGLACYKAAIVPKWVSKTQQGNNQATDKGLDLRDDLQCRARPYAATANRWRKQATLTEKKRHIGDAMA